MLRPLPGAFRRPCSAFHSSLFGLLAILILSAGCAHIPATDAPPPPAVRAIKAIPYATGHVLMPDGAEGTRVLTMDVYMPGRPGKTLRPTLLLIHGGGFAEGDPSQMEQLAHFFVERGFVCFANSYRLRRDRPDATPAAALADCMTAVRWVRRHAAQYGARPDAIGALGYSAGAFAAVAVAIADPGDYRVDGPVIAPFNTPGVSPGLQAAVSVAGGLSSADEMDPGDPPLLVVHGVRDPVVAVERGRAICEAAHQHGVTCEFIPIERADHWPLNADYKGQNVKEYIAEFLHRHLDKPAGPAPVTLPPSELSASVNCVREIPTPPQPAPDAPLVTLDTSPTRHGEVLTDPPGDRFTSGTVVRLTPVPQPGYEFAFWAGDIRETCRTAWVVMDRDRRIQAGFIPRPDAPRVTLRTHTRGPGDLIVRPPLDQYVKGDDVTLEAVPHRGARFSRWMGIPSAADPTTTIIMDENRTITAVFETVIQVEREQIRLAPDGDHASLRVESPSRQWQMAALWPVPGWTVDRRAARRGSITITAAPNASGYARGGFLRLTAPGLGERYVQIALHQDSLPGAPQSATPIEPGALVYRGLGEPGRLVWWNPSPADPWGRVLMANGDGTFTLAAPRTTPIGTLTVKDDQPLQIPDDRPYHLYAEWDLPALPELFNDPDDPSVLGTSYCYVGIDSGAVDNSKLRFGIEWKNIGQGNEWVVRGQYESREFAARAQNSGRVPRHIRVHVWKAYDGEDGNATVHAEYQLDDGPWQPYRFVTPGHPDAYPLGLRGEDAGADWITFKVRGLASTAFGPLRLEAPALSQAAP